MMQQRTWVLKPVDGARRVEYVRAGKYHRNIILLRLKRKEVTALLIYPDHNELKTM